MSNALRKLEMSMGEYFMRLHYAFWDVAKKMTEEKQMEEESKEQQVIRKLKKMGVLEDGNAGR